MFQRETFVTTFPREWLRFVGLPVTITRNQLFLTVLCHKGPARLHFHFIPVIDCGMTKGSPMKGFSLFLFLSSSVRLIEIQKNRYRYPHSCNTRANNYSTSSFHRLWLSCANIMLCDKTPDCPPLVISAIDGNYLFHWISSIIMRHRIKEFQSWIHIVMRGEFIVHNANLFSNGANYNTILKDTFL